MHKYFAALVVLFTSFSCKKNTDSAFDRFPAGKTKEFVTVEGINVPDKDLRISLFALEPDVINPTNMDIDHKGRVWIAAAYNYRNEVNLIPYEKKGDRILILEDTDGDGVSDLTKVYYQGEDVNSAMGVTVLGNKVIVSCSPYVLMFTDEDGDDVPDKKEILFRTQGGYQSDHGIHSFTFGPDGKLYFTFGNHVEALLDKNGKVIKDIYGREIANNLKPFVDGMLVRCDENGENFEVLGWNFRNNYELAIDSYGRIWQGDNDDDGVRSNRINYVLPHGNYGYKDEMTGADWRAYRTNKEDSTWQQHWHQNDPGVVPNLKITGAGSPTGMFYYEGDMLPDRYKNSFFLADAGRNNVISYYPQKQGAGFALGGSMVLDASEKDRWFRPTDITVAPDGSVFVADWYDVGVGGHAVGDLEKGRIYRVFKKGHEKYNVPKYDFDDINSCIEALKSPAVSVRYMANKALIKPESKEKLYELARSADPVFAARALWILSKNNPQILEEFSSHPNEDLRAALVRMAQPKDHSDFLIKMSKDPSMQVKQAVATRIYHTDNLEAWLNLAQIYRPGDRFYLEALGIGASGKWDLYLDKYLENNPDFSNPAVKEMIWRSRADISSSLLAKIIRSIPFKESLKYYRALDFQNPEFKNKELLKLLTSAPTEDERVLIFKHFDADFAQNNADFRKVLPEVIKNIKNDRDFLDITLRYRMEEQRERILNILDNAKDRTLINQAAITASQLFGYMPLKEAIDRKPLDPAWAKKRIERMGLVDVDGITKQLILVFTNKKYPFELRETAVLAMEGYMSDIRLWDLMKVNKVSPELMPAAISVMKKTFHNDLKAEFEHLYGQPEEISDIIMPDFNKGKGDANQGKEIFLNACTICHTNGTTGSDFGPGLGNIGGKLTKEGLFNAIVYPNQGVSLGYETSVIQFNDGSSVRGIVTSKTAGEYLVKIPGNDKLMSYPLNSVKSVEVLPNESMMPAFPYPEKEMLNLIEYLSTLK